MTPPPENDTPSPASLDMSALTAPISRAVIKQFWRTFQPQHPEVKDVRSRAWWVAITIGLIVGIFGAFMLISGIVSAITEVNRDASGNDVGMAFVGGIMTVAGVALFWIGRRTERQRTSPEMHYRLSQFAEDNGMYYQPGPWLGAYLTPWASRGGDSKRRDKHPVNHAATRASNLVIYRQVTW